MEGGGGGTHASGWARVRRVATGGFSGFTGAFFLGGGFEEGFTGCRGMAEGIAGGMTGGGGIGSTGNFICAAISSADKHKGPQCSIMYPEMCVIPPWLLSRRGYSPLCS